MLENKASDLYSRTTEVEIHVGDDIPPYNQAIPLFTQVLRFAIVFVISAVVVSVALLFTNERMPNPKVVRPLPDLLFDILPKVAWLEPVVDILIFILNLTAVYVILKIYVLACREKSYEKIKLFSNIKFVGSAVNNFLFSVVDSGRRPYPLEGIHLIALIRFLTVYAIMLLYRSVVLVLTAYPATDNQCQNPQTIENPLLNIVLTLLTFGSASIHCGDLMFSGHTIIICLAWIIIWDYSVYVHRFIFRLYSTVVMFVAFYGIIASRSHYTNDIVVAAYSTVTTFMLISHQPHGAPWQLQMLIRWWPFPGSNTERSVEV
ncbi:unnamed protein product [Phytomonas sp. EM1]|nr:unnamed protein product [Phytomonas sp. EM1]|eukprot:CCW64397.1 unnamed protein product [Phytomonas sp. isolate EM1]